MLYLRYLPLVLILAACGKPPPSAVEGFQSRDQHGLRTYLFTHYDVIEPHNDTVRNPFGEGSQGKLRDAQLTIRREILSRIGQCLYQVRSDRPLSAHTPAALREMLREAKPLAEEQKFVPLDVVYAEMRDFRDLYGHRLPWYANYLAIGGVVVALNGVYDIATHDAQAEAIKIAQAYVHSDAYRRELAQELLSNEDIHRSYTDAHGRMHFSKINDPDELEALLKGWRKDMYELMRQQDKLIVASGQAEHKLEELFGRFIYAGREAKIFGRTVNLNPLWALKEKTGQKLVPLVQQLCQARVSVICVGIITSAAGLAIAGAVPLTYFLTGKINAFFHREQEQRRLLDIVGDWDNFRTFTQLKYADMQKLQQKMFKLSAKGTSDCPPPETLADLYIDKKSGRFY